MKLTYEIFLDYFKLIIDFFSGLPVIFIKICTYVMLMYTSDGGRGGWIGRKWAERKWTKQKRGNTSAWCYRICSRINVEQQLISNQDTDEQEDYLQQSPVYLFLW